MDSSNRDVFGFGDLEALAASVRESDVPEVEDGEEGSGHALDVDTKSTATVEPEEAPIVRIAKVIIQRMIIENADTALISAYANCMNVRYRINGSWHEVMRLRKYCHPPVVSRFKIMAGMNIAERKVPQRGKIHIRHAGKDYDLLCQTMPTASGERFAISVINRDTLRIGIGALGLTKELHQRLLGLANGHSGLLLVCGNDDMGIHSTMYSLLRAADEPEAMIATIEDPVLMAVDNWSQTYVDRTQGLTIGVGLKYLAGLSPDIVMASLMPGIEVAEAALGLAHHAFVVGRAPGDSIEKILSLYGEYFGSGFLLPSLCGVLRRSVIRLNCQECASEYRPDDRLAAALGISEGADSTNCRRGVGCEVCRFCGYRESRGVYEYAPVTREVYQVMTSRCGLDHAIARELGAQTAQAQIRALVASGEASVEEGLRALRM